tara:strand:- start:1213 stop:1464 length:252 start_codon:yes stop_codon:yes gene_type:complete
VTILSEILAGKRKDKTVSVRIPDEIVTKLDEIAEERGDSRQLLLLEIILRGIKDFAKVNRSEPQRKPTVLGDRHVYNPDRFIL